MVGITEDKQEGDNTQIEGQQMTASKGKRNQNNTDMADTSSAAAVGASKGILFSGTAKGYDRKASGAFS